MASMKYCDKHNQVGFLKKPEESTGFAEIAETATASTLADGTLELRATIENIFIYKSLRPSFRIQSLHLADASRIKSEVFKTPTKGQKLSGEKDITLQPWKQLKLQSRVLLLRGLEKKKFNLATKEKKNTVQFESQFYTEETGMLLIQDLVNQRKKHFAEERAKAKRNKPMTQSHLRIYMSNYLKNQGTWKLSQIEEVEV
ncbi:hypothetical protein Tco_0252199 [Tanacetum coccineum]